MADVKITFMCPEPLADLIGKVGFDIDRNKSEIIRACLLLGIDTISQVPTLTNRLSMEDRKGHQKSTR